MQITSKWKVKESDKQLQKKLSSQLNILPLTAQVLINRDITDILQAEAFLKANISSLHNPFLLTDMEKAISRIKQAISKNEKIMIYGDYDVDGVSSVALMVSVLKEMKANVISYIPNRLSQGYGLNKDSAQMANQKQVSVVITVDCGITAFDEVEEFKKFNIDVIITDHHKPKDNRIPNAYAVINSLRDGDEYPYKHLAGVGIAYKLLQALTKDVIPAKAGIQFLYNYLDIVSLGTVADVAPLSGENRVIVKKGLEILSQSKRIGLKALIDTTGLEGKELQASHIGFVLGPRINATGRLSSANTALELLLSENKSHAERIAKAMNNENARRQNIEAQTLVEAVEMIERDIDIEKQKVIVIAKKNWHPGVIGIVSARIVERFNRPTIMLSIADGIGKGSGRSIKNFHLFEALKNCENVLQGFGGHKYACGLTIDEDNIDKFRDAINVYADKVLTAEDFIPVIDIDAEAPLTDITKKLLDEIETLKPFGVSNPHPLIVSYGLKLKGQPRIMASKHIKFWVTDGGLVYEAIWFGKADCFDTISKANTIDIVYTPAINSWNGVDSIQLKVKDVKIA